MGQFSWITQDTGEVIRESFGCNDKYKISAFMHDDKGNVWAEKNYEGYGVFGGKDYYELLAEMNGIEASDYEIENNMEQFSQTRERAYTDVMRSKGITIAFGDAPFKAPNLTRHHDWDWIAEVPEDDPNQGWIG